MPIYEFCCSNGHTTNKLYKSYTDFEGDSIICEFKYKNGRICNKKAEKQISSVAIIFQPYAFSDTCFASHSEREKYVNGSATDMGAAHKDSKKKFPPNRQFTRYKGKKLKNVKS